MWRDELARQAGASGAVGVGGSGAPWLSILIPVYNVAPSLRLCVDSVLGQLPGEGVEVILLDDASTDRSLSICEELAEAHAPLVHLLAHERNRCLSAARNTMLEAARGEYVWFVDSDDEMLPGAIAGLRGVLDEHSPDLVLCDYLKGGKHLRSFAGPEKILIEDCETVVQGVFASRRMHTWTKIARRTLWGSDLRFPIGRCYEDMATTPWLFLRARSAYYVPSPWMFYRTRADSITASVGRVRNQFDEAKNDDVAGALVGFASAARDALPEISPPTIYCMAQFCTKEFTKIAWRLLRACALKEGWGTVGPKLRGGRSALGVKFRPAYVPGRRK